MKYKEVRENIENIINNSENIEKNCKKINAKINKMMLSAGLTALQYSELCRYRDILLEYKKTNNIIEDTVQAYIKEAVKFFCKPISKQARVYEEGGYYFYSKDEVKEVLEKVKAKGGDVNQLHVGTMYYDNGRRVDEILGYEIVHKWLWDNHRECCYAGMVIE